MIYLTKGVILDLKCLYGFTKIHLNREIFSRRLLLRHETDFAVNSDFYESDII